MFTMNRLISFILLVLVITNSLASELLPGRSSYSFRLGVLDCNNVGELTGCRHEIGHKMDGDLGMPSQSPEFAIATQTLVQVMWLTLEPDDFAVFISVYPDKNPVELYAGLYSYVEGDISKLPTILQPFFSDDPSYLNLYNCLARTGLNICGRSFSYLKGETQ